MYECAKCLDTCLSNAATAASPSLSALTDARHLLVHKEGFVHCSTFGIASAGSVGGRAGGHGGVGSGGRAKGGGPPRVPLVSENRVRLEDAFDDNVVLNKVNTHLASLLTAFAWHENTEGGNTSDAGFSYRFS